MKKIFTLFVVFAMAISMFACGGGNNDDYITIGYIGNLSGSAKYYGEQVQMGINLAVEQINAEGTVLGKKVRIIAKDDAGDANQAVTVYNQIKDSVVGIIGPVLSGTSEAVASLANEDGIPMITPSGSAESLTKDRDFVFRTCLTDPSQGTYLANFAKSKGFNKVVVLKNTSSAYSSGICEYFATQAAANELTIATTISYTDTDYQTRVDTIVQQILDANPDCVILPDYSKVNATFVESLHNEDATIPFLGADGWDGIVEAVDITPTFFNNCYFTNNLFSGDTSEVITGFYQSFKAKYNTDDISAFAALAYDATYLMKDAIVAANSTDKATIKDAIKNVTFTGVTGSITFDANGNPNRDVPIIKVVDGKYVLETKITA